MPYLTAACVLVHVVVTSATFLAGLACLFFIANAKETSIVSNTVFLVPTRRLNAVALGDIRRLLYGTETSVTPTRANERASLYMMYQMILTPVIPTSIHPRSVASISSH